MNLVHFKRCCRNLTTYSLKTLLLSVMLAIGAYAARAQYCTPINISTWSSSCAGSAILNVKFNTIDHSAGCVASANPADYYKDLTTTVAPTSVAAGLSYSLSVVHSANWDGMAAVWIDFNGNQLFDPAERVAASTTSSVGGVVTATVTVPFNAVPGTTRMRVVAREGASLPDPCDPNGYAEVEDYRIEILPPPYNNAAVTAFSPVQPFCSGPSVTRDVLVRVANRGSNQINAVSVQWEVDGFPQQPYVFSSTLDTFNGTGVNDTLLNIGPVTFSTSSPKRIKAWTSSPNNVADTTNHDDTILFTITPMLDGTYTIGAPGADFATLGEAVAALQGGICGPVVLNLTGTGQVYNEQVNITAVPGASATSTVTINGNGNILEYAVSSAARYLIRLQGAKHITINNLVLRSTSTDYGWGVHFYQSADSNTINGCTIDMSLVTSTTANNSGGIVFSNSASTITSASANGKGNLISNNIIKGGASGGLYYGIVLIPAGSGSFSTSNPTYNRIINNTISDFYGYGIYCSYTNGTLIKGNTISNRLKTANASIVYGIGYPSTSGSMSDTITGNTISNPFGSVTGSTGTFYGIYLTSSATNTPAGKENLVSNNIIYGVRSNGTQYGISCEPAPRTRIYHNTITFDHTSTGSATVTRGFYMTSGTNIDFRNNIITITRGGSGAKHLIYFNTATAATSDYNTLYITTAATNHVGYSGSNRTLITDWRTGSAQDNNSLFEDPLFAYAPAGNLEPQNSTINGSGTGSLAAAVTEDIRNVARTSPPDPGAIEFTPSGCFTPSNLAVSNIGSFGAVIGWTAPTPVPNGGYEYVVSTSSAIPSGSGTAAATNSDSAGNLNPSSVYYVFVRSVCSGVPGIWAGPVSFTTLCAPLPGGTYTIGGTSPDFANFTEFVGRISCGAGIAGPITVNVAPNSGPYNEQIIIPYINGSSSADTIVINGNGNTIQFNVSSGNRSVIRLQGAQYITIDSLNIKSLNTTYGWGIHFMQSAMYNRIKRCVIDMTSVTSRVEANCAGIVFSNATSGITTAASAGANGSFNTIDGNTILGHPSGNGMNIGIALTPASAATTYSANRIINNTIRNFNGVGIWCKNTNGTIIRNNLIENTTKASFESSIYGISMNTQYRNDSIKNNVIRNLTGTGAGSSASATLYGIYFTNTTASANLTPAGNEMYIINNLIYGFRSAGDHYGIYSSNATNSRFYHNTINLDDAGSSASLARGYYHTGTASGNGIDFRNNLVSVTRAGTGSKHAIYINASSGVYSFDHNGYYTAGSGADVAYFGGNSYATLNGWNDARGLDLNSRFIDPEFVSAATGNLTPDAGMLKKVGAHLAGIVPVDFNGVAHDSLPDPGALAFTPTAADDAGVYELILPAALPSGAYTPSVRIFNGGANVLQNAMIHWEVNGAVQTPVFFNGSLATGGISQEIPLNAYLFGSGVAHTIKAWTTQPNGMADGKPANDTVVVENVYTALPGGVYTINSSAPASSTNFTSYASFIQTVEDFGIDGPVTVNVLDSLTSTPVVLSKPIAGTSAQSPIVFKGIDTVHTVISTNAQASVTLRGVKHIMFRDMLLVNTSASSASVVWLSNSADSNSIINCSIHTRLSTSSSSLFGILASANATYKSAGVNAKGTLVDSCFIKGGDIAVLFCGITPAVAEPYAPDLNRHNKVRNSVILQPYSTGIHAEFQSAFEAHRNTLTHVGNGVNTFPAGIALRENLVEGSRINGNILTGMLGGEGISAIWDVSLGSLISNNMIQMGTGTYDMMGIRWIGTSADFVYNSINVTSASVNGGAAFMLSPTSGNTYNVLNNIFRNDNPGQLMVIGTTNVQMKLDNNCYYGTGNFPYRVNNTNAATLADFKALANINSDSFSLTIDPGFISATNLRTFNPQLNGKGRFFARVTTDVDDNPRDPNTPDIGASEYNLITREDAGVIAITSPSTPVTPGGNADVSVVIRNLGVGALTSADVTYSYGMMSQTIQYTGNLAEGETDTVHFLFSAGKGMIIPLSGPFEVLAFTSNPNMMPDQDGSNDSFTVTICQPMSGSYTIDPAGSGATNFLSFTEAMDALKCGGVSGPVEFSVASGTYRERLFIPAINGAGPASTITFRSASGIRSDVVLTDSSTNDTNNYLVYFLGANDLVFSSMTLENKGESHSRVFVYKMNAGVGCSNIRVTGCNVTAPVASANDAKRVLFYGDNESNTRIYIVNNTISRGAMGVYLGGFPTKNQYSNEVVVDSNTFIDNAYNAIVLSYRNGISVRKNVIHSSSATMANGISLYEVSGDIFVSSNNISLVQGAGIRFYRAAFYNEPGNAYVTSNAVHLTGTGDVNQMGIGLIATSKVYTYNNTIKTNSSKTSLYSSYTPNYGLYVQGEVVAANLQNTATFGLRFLNNIVQTQYGYPMFIDDVVFGTGGNQLSRLAVVENNNNLYYNANGANVAFVVSTDYPKTNFNAFRGAIRAGSDSISRYLEVPFSAGTLKPSESDTLAWWINGRALHASSVSMDVNGNPRATVPFDGVPDIGAYEITPVVLPPLAVAIPALPVAGGSQVFLFMGDTVARISYSASVTPPASIEVRQFVGERPPQISPNQKFMYHYVSVEMPLGVYDYSVDVHYRDEWTGTMSTNEPALRMITRDYMGFWSMAPMGTLDAVANIISAPYLIGHIQILTGTDPSDPLPARLLSFQATKAGADEVLVRWVSATEKNVKHYVLERSSDGVNFADLVVLDAKNAPAAYSYADNIRGVNASYLHYRLRIVDHDGSSVHSGIVTVSPDRAGMTISVAPNPVSDQLRIRLSSAAQEPVTVSVFGLRGEKIFEEVYYSNVPEISRDVRELKPGLYFVRITCGNISETIRFIKQ